VLCSGRNIVFFLSASGATEADKKAFRILQEHNKAKTGKNRCRMISFAAALKIRQAKKKYLVGYYQTTVKRLKA